MLRSSLMFSFYTQISMPLLGPEVYGSFRIQYFDQYCTLFPLKVQYDPLIVSQKEAPMGAFYNINNNIFHSRTLPVR